MHDDDENELFFGNLEYLIDKCLFTYARCHAMHECVGFDISIY